MIRRLVSRSEHGYTLAELLIVLAIIAIMAGIAVPFLLTYIPRATVNYAARELQSGLNRAKFMAVTTRPPVRAQPRTARHPFFHSTTATGTPWSRARTGTDGRLTP